MTTTYNEICRVLDKVRDLRREYTNFGYDDSLKDMVDILIKCEDDIEREARKWCSNVNKIES